MFKTFKTILIMGILFIPFLVYADNGIGGGLIGGGEVIIGWREIASQDVVRPRTIITDIGTITDNNDGSIRLYFASSDLASNKFLRKDQNDTSTYSYDFGGGGIEVPNSASLPATCTVGQIYMDTDATSGQRIYACQSANTWTLQGDGGGGGGTPGGLDTQVQFNDASSFGGDSGLTYNKTTDLLSGVSLNFSGTATSDVVDAKYIEYSSGGVVTVRDGLTVNGNIIEQNAYYQYILLPESATLDDGNPPAITVIESTGTGTARFRVADFDATTDEILYWTFVVPDDMASGNWFADVSWYSNDVGPNETCFWELAISATTEADVDTPAEQAAGTSQTASEDVNETEANRLMQTTITISNLDSVAAGDVVTIVFNRDANNASDDLSSDARLISVRLRIPRG